jgi:Flp pilus assembly protein TadD
MYSHTKRRFATTFRNVLLGSAVLLASGCAVDWPGSGQTSYRWTQNPPVATNAQDSYELGKKQFAQGLFGMALKSFRVALVQDPKSLDRLNSVAATYDKLGRFDLAERYYAQALGVDPNSVQTLNNVGYSFLMQKDYISARYYLEQAARIASTEDNYTNIVGANLVSLDIAEGRGATMLASQAQPVESAAASVDEMKSGTEGEVHVIATNQDVAKVEVAGIMPEQAGGRDGVGILNDQTVLVPAALPFPAVETAPIGRVEKEPLLASTAPAADKTADPAAKPSKPAKRIVASNSQMLVEISNGAGRRHLAARTRQFLQSEGIDIGRLTNANHFSFEASTIFYREGFGEKAREIAGLFPMEMEMKKVKEQRSDIRVLLGADSLAFDSRRLAEFKGF